MTHSKEPLEIVNPAKPWTPDKPDDPQDVKDAIHKIQEQTEEIEKRSLKEPEHPGSTGQYPQGKLTPDDLGEIKIRVGMKQDKVIIDFGTSVAWVAMTGNQSIDMGNMLLKAGRHVNKAGKQPNG